MRAAEVRGRSGKQEPGITSRLAASLCYWLRVRPRAAGVRDEGDFFFESETNENLNTFANPGDDADDDCETDQTAHPIQASNDYAAWC